MPVPHLGEIDAVRAEAVERNTVLAVFVLQEGEEANDRFREGVYKHADVVKRCADLVVLLVNDGQHATKTLREKKGKETVERKVCSVYHTPSCDDHRRYFDRIFQDYNEDGVMRTPQLLLVLPNGKIKERIVDQHDVKQITRAIDRAKAIAGPSLTSEQLADVKSALGIGRTMQRTGKWVEAWRHWTRVLELISAGKFADEAKEGVETCLQGMGDDLKAAGALLEKGKIAAGYARLLELKAAFQGTPLEKEAAKVLRDAEKNKEWKEEIEKYKDEVAAEEIWKKVAAARDEEKQGSAERHAKRILSRYPDTKAAARVRREFPHLVQEDGAR